MEKLQCYNSEHARVWKAFSTKACLFTRKNNVCHCRNI